MSEQESWRLYARVVAFQWLYATYQKYSRVLHHVSTSRDLQVGKHLGYAYTSKLLSNTRNDIVPKPVVLCKNKPTTRDKLWTKRSPLDNLEVNYFMKLMLRFSKTQVRRYLEGTRLWVLREQVGQRWVKIERQEG